MHHIHNRCGTRVVAAPAARESSPTVAGVGDQLHAPGCTMIVVVTLVPIRIVWVPGVRGCPRALPSRPAVRTGPARPGPEDVVVRQDGIRQLRVDPDDLHASAVDGRTVGDDRKNLLEADLRSIPAVERRWCRCGSNVLHSFEYPTTRNTFVRGSLCTCRRWSARDGATVSAADVKASRRGAASAERVLCARRLEHRCPNCGELVTQLVRGCGAHRRCRRERTQESSRARRFESSVAQRPQRCNASGSDIYQ